MKAIRSTRFAGRGSLTRFLVGMARCAVRRRRAQRQAAATNGRDARFGLRAALRFAAGGDSAERFISQPPDQCQEAPPAIRALNGSCRFGQAGLSKSVIGPRPSVTAFTLMELLVVISILGILAALSLPALKNLGKSNLQVSASRQLQDDIGRARQLAISQHTTVYMVFVPELWNLPVGLQTPAMASLLDKQLTGYNFVSLRSVGDQPGQGVPRYIHEWKSLPDGAFIATNKFYYTSYITNSTAGGPEIYRINPFYSSTQFPFPKETNFSSGIFLPFIAFNYRGQLTVDGVELAAADEYIPLAQGNVLYAADANKALTFKPADFSENPPGNSANSMFTVIRIDRLTGRATLLKQKVQ